MTQEQDKPNILVIQADQMTPFILPAYGNKIALTPNIDRLAANGAVFENAYCNFPLCVPSRMSMLTGRLTSAIAQWDNAVELPASVPTLAHHMRAAGYHTVLCGKMHFIGPDQVHGFDERITTDIYPSNFAWTPDWIVGERYRPTGINPRAVVEAGQSRRNLQVDYDDEVAHAGVQKVYDLARFNRDRPFMMWVSFTHPHSPFVTHPKYWDMFEHDKIDMPKVDPIPVDELDQMSRWLHYGHAQDLLTIEEEHVRNARHAYYGMCAYIDEKVGQMMSVLEDMDLLDNTIIVFTSDHGEMLGERGMWFKQSFFESSSRVPLIVTQPGGIGAGRVSEITSLVDLLPTFVAWGGGTPPTDVSPLDGHNLTPLINGDTAGWDNSVVVEYTGEGVSAPCRMVRRDNYKYIYTHGHPPQLFDLDADPLELTNLAGNEAVARIEARLRDELMRDYDPDDVNRRCIQSQKERLFIHAATDGEPGWAYVNRAGDDARYIRNASAVGVKAKSRYPFVEPTPFER